VAVKLDRAARREDLESLPEGVRGEIIDGTLYTQPRPRLAHAFVEQAVAGDLGLPFGRGRGGPGGWWILVKPGIEAGGSPEFVPDLASWRRERLVDLPERLTIVPDWICEILSPGTRNYDQRVKRPFYARLGVSHLWFVDPDARTLTVDQLIDGRWTELAVHGNDDVIRAAPFDAIEIALGEWWTK
jgi:Uma2 family endonuclease